MAVGDQRSSGFLRRKEIKTEQIHRRRRSGTGAVIEGVCDWRRRPPGAAHRGDRCGSDGGPRPIRRHAPGDARETRPAPGDRSGTGETRVLRSAPAPVSKRPPLRRRLRLPAAPVAAAVSARPSARRMRSLRKEREGGKHEYVVDSDRCIGCGFCAGACPLRDLASDRKRSSGVGRFGTSVALYHFGKGDIPQTRAILYQKGSGHVRIENERRMC